MAPGGRKGRSRIMGGVTRVEDIPRVIESLCAMYDESVANLRGALARYLKSGERPDPAERAPGPVRLSRASHRLSLQPVRGDTGALLRPAQPSRPLRQQHLAPLSLPQISDRAAHLSDRRLRGRGHGRPLGQRNPLSLCPRRHRRPQARRRPGARSLALVPDHRARPYRRRARRRRMDAAAGRAAAFVAVRRAASRFQPGAAAPLYRHARPSTPSATCCSPIISAMSTSSSAGRSTS